MAGEGGSRGVASAGCFSGGIEGVDVRKLGDFKRE